MNLLDKLIGPKVVVVLRGIRAMLREAVSVSHLCGKRESTARPSCSSSSAQRLHVAHRADPYH